MRKCGGCGTNLRGVQMNDTVYFCAPCRDSLTAGQKRKARSAARAWRARAQAHIDLCRQEGTAWVPYSEIEPPPCGPRGDHHARPRLTT